MAKIIQEDVNKYQGADLVFEYKANSNFFKSIMSSIIAAMGNNLIMSFITIFSLS
jgi:hypothetical protein